ncbi:MAG: hypothetical protein ACXVZL_00175 [Gaiellaceae bacterium]
MTNDEPGLDPANEANEDGEAEARTVGICGGMADFRRMFERCMSGAAPAEANEPPAATAACLCEQGVRPC